MKYLPITAALAGLLLLPLPALGHGGTYNGPGDVVPPGGLGGGNGGGNPPTPGTPSPHGPGPANPNSPSPGPVGSPQGGPGPANGPVSTPGFVESQDLTDWAFWWEFNKHSFLNLRERLADAQPVTGTGGWYLGENTGAQDTDRHSVKAKDLDDLVVPALLKALREETHADILTGCMMSLAKVGDRMEEDGSSAFAGVITPFLADANAEISETAALALGILGSDEAVPTLLALASDDDAGRKLVARGEVPRRTRSFAVYALGLVARQTSVPELRSQVFNRLSSLLTDEATSSRDLAVACIQALGLFQVDAMVADEGASLTAQLELLLEVMGDERRLHGLVRSHVPTALARTFTEREATLGEPWRQRILVAVLDLAEGHDVDKHMLRGAVLAMGQLADRDSDDIDASTRRFLEDDLADLGDSQARRFGLVAMGQIAGRMGSDDAGLASLKKELLGHMVRGKSGMREWAAVGLGIFGHRAPADFGTELTGALRTSIEEQRGPKVGAYAVAAGLTGAEELVEPLLEKLDDIQDDDARGYICMALGLIGEPGAAVMLEDIVRDSTFREGLLRQASIGLGMVGGRQSAELLLDTLVGTKALTAQAALANALGIVGDRRSLPPLVSVLQDSDRPDLARGLAAAALGNICDTRMLPWNEPLARDINYRSATDTLTTSDGKGILDIL